MVSVWGAEAKVREGAESGEPNPDALPHVRSVFQRDGLTNECNTGPVVSTARRRKRGDAGIYTLLVAVGMALSVFTAVSYISARASMNSSLAITSEALALQLSIMCNERSVALGGCVYSSNEGEHVNVPGCRRIPSSTETDGWFCHWNGFASGAPAHVSDTLLTVVEPDISISGVYLSVDRDINGVSVRLGGCYTGGWLPLGSICGRAERFAHL